MRSAGSAGYMGLPHKQIKQLRPQDVNLRAGTMIVSARRKGRGVERRSILLTAEGLEALRLCGPGLPGIVLQFQRVEVLATGL